MNSIESSGIKSLNKKFKRFIKNGYKFDKEMRQKRKERNIKIYKSIKFKEAK